MSKKADSSNMNIIMGASTKQGYNIAIKSRKIVKSLIDHKTRNMSPLERSIVERIVHSTADPDYADITKISADFVDESLKAILMELDILTDITMVSVGINAYPGKVKCYINHEMTVEIAEKLGITRAAAAMQAAALEGFEGIVVIGNSPTALLEVLRLSGTNKMKIKSIIGAPVGFVGAAESKEALSKTKIPHLLTQGPKGGTPVAVAAINSLINLGIQD